VSFLVLLIIYFSCSILLLNLQINVVIISHFTCPPFLVSSLFSSLYFFSYSSYLFSSLSSFYVSFTTSSCPTHFLNILLFFFFHSWSSSCSSPDSFLHVASFFRPAAERCYNSTEVNAVHHTRGPAPGTSFTLVLDSFRGNEDGRLDCQMWGFRHLHQWGSWSYRYISVPAFIRLGEIFGSEKSAATRGQSKLQNLVLSVVLLWRDLHEGRGTREILRNFGRETSYTQLQRTGHVWEGCFGTYVTNSLWQWWTGSG
jgi:hypothetical protein